MKNVGTSDSSQVIGEPCSTWTSEGCRPVYLNKRWYRAYELPVITGIPRSFWRLHKKRDDVWIWRKTGTHRSAPVFLHVESVADELDRRRIPYFVNINGREVDPSMRGYCHVPVSVRKPRGKLREAPSKAIVSDPVERARNLIAALDLNSEEASRQSQEELDLELFLFRLEKAYLCLRMSQIGTAIEMLERASDRQREEAVAGPAPGRVERRNRHAVYRQKANRDRQSVLGRGLPEIMSGASLGSVEVG